MHCPDWSVQYPPLQYITLVLCIDQCATVSFQFVICIVQIEVSSELTWVCSCTLSSVRCPVCYSQCPVCYCECTQSTLQCPVCYSQCVPKQGRTDKSGPATPSLCPHRHPWLPISPILSFRFLEEYLDMLCIENSDQAHLCPHRHPWLTISYQSLPWSIHLIRVDVTNQIWSKKPFVIFNSVLSIWAQN